MLVELDGTELQRSRFGDHRELSERRPTHVPAVGLAGSELSERFCFWRGRSGRRYVFSVYRSATCDGESLPRYPDAVIVVARRNAGGVRTIIDLGDSGALPEISAILSGPLRERHPDVEVHVHLLAHDRAGRRAVLDDLAGAVRVG